MVLHPLGLALIAAGAAFIALANKAEKDNGNGNENDGVRNSGDSGGPADRTRAPAVKPDRKGSLNHDGENLQQTDAGVSPGEPGHHRSGEQQPAAGSGQESGVKAPKTETETTGENGNDAEHEGSGWRGADHNSGDVGSESGGGDEPNASPDVEGHSGE